MAHHGLPSKVGIARSKVIHFQVLDPVTGSGPSRGPGPKSVEKVLKVFRILRNVMRMHVGNVDPTHKWEISV